MTNRFAWPDAELAFVARASVGAVQPAITAQVHDWKRVVDLAVTHRVFPRVLRNAGAKIPEQFVTQLREHAATNSRAILANLAKTAEVTTLLRRAGLHPLVIKGPLLSCQLFGDYGMRVSGDVDILIPESELLQSAQLLSAHGYAHHTPATAAALAHHRKTEHDVAFAHPADATLVELHADIAQPHYAFNLDLSDWWQRARTCNIGDARVSVPALEDAYLIAVLHASRHQWSRLDLIADIAAFQCLDIDRATIQKCAESAGVLRILHVAESLADELRGEGQGGGVARSLLEKLAEGRGFSRWQGFWLDWRLRERAGDRLRYLVGRGLRLPRRALQ